MPLMPRPIQRATKLSEEVKREFLERHVPGRIALVKCALSRIDTGRISTYYDYTVAAVASRCLAQFLGLKMSSKGKLVLDKRYFVHDTGEEQLSYEVKISDVCSVPLLDPNELTQEERHHLEVGFDTINREVAHFTYWEPAPRQHSNDAQDVTYYEGLVSRLERFSHIVLREVEERTKTGRTTASSPPSSAGAPGIRSQ